QLQLVIGPRVGLGDLRQADAATGDDGQSRVVAIMRDLDDVLEGDLKDGLFALKRADLAINGNLGHGCIPSRRRRAAPPPRQAGPGQSRIVAEPASASSRPALGKCPRPRKFPRKFPRKRPRKSPPRSSPGKCPGTP